MRLQNVHKSRKHYKTEQRSQVCCQTIFHVFSKGSAKFKPCDRCGQQLTGHILHLKGANQPEKYSNWSSCIQTCMENDAPSWYASRSTAYQIAIESGTIQRWSICLPLRTTVSITARAMSQLKHRRDLEILHGVARVRDNADRTPGLRSTSFERRDFCLAAEDRCANEILLGLFLSGFLCVCLLLQQNRIDECDALIYRSAQETTRFEYSWALLSTSWLVVLMFTGIMPTVRWFLRDHYGANVEAEGGIFSSCDPILRVYDSLFSYKNGRLFMAKGLVMETIEVCTQGYQLYSFSHDRPREWLTGVSSLLLLNGLLVPAPFVLRKLVPKWERVSRLLLIGCDATFDISYILMNVIHSNEMEFIEETWWVATAGVFIPAFSIVLLVLDLVDFAMATSVGKIDSRQ